MSAPGLVLALALAAAPDSAAADTGLGGYLGGLADSTDRYFGITGAPVDTASFDSLLAAGLERPDANRRATLRIAPGPWLGFNRVDGPRWGASLTVGTRSLGELAGKLGYAAGPNDWLGGGEYSRRWSRRPRAARGYAAEPVWSLDLSAGRFTGVLDPDRHESIMALARAFVWGTDRQHYLRRDGARAALTRESATVRLGLDARDELESPRDVTAGWNLLRRAPVVGFNLPARLGRVRELGFEATVRLGSAPVWIEAESRFADHAWGSDLTYTRHRVAAAAEIPVFGVASLVSQATWGRLDGRDIPQASFFLGGATSLRSVPGWSLAGTRKALARVDLLTAGDLLEAIRVPHPSELPVQAGVFGGVGAVWGDDPYGGPGTPEEDWPDRGAWLTEAGVALLYRPGLPDPRGFIRVDWAWPIGSDDRRKRFVVYYSRPIDLLRVTGR